MKYANLKTHIHAKTETSLKVCNEAKGVYFLRCKEEKQKSMLSFIFLTKKETSCFLSAKLYIFLSTSIIIELGNKTK